MPIHDLPQMNQSPTDSLSVLGIDIPVVPDAVSIQQLQAIYEVLLTASSDVQFAQKAFKAIVRILAITPNLLPGGYQI